MIAELWKRYRSVKNGGKSKSKKTSKTQIAAKGCFWVYVGQEKQRFEVKAMMANHPLFKILLEDAKIEYGYSFDGPIMLPCDVNLFDKVVAEIEGDDEFDLSPSYSRKGCRSLVGCSPGRGLICGGRGEAGAYRVLRSSPMVRLNRSS